MRRAERFQLLNQVECGLRVVEGYEPGLGQRFRHGLATLGSGSIVFVPFAGGVRFLRRRPVTVSVQVVDRSEQRTSGFMAQLSAIPGSRVITVRTNTATLEWVLPPAQTAWASQQVSPHS